MSNIIDRILAEVCLDERIQDGIFDMSNNSHMEALRESMTDKFGISLNDSLSIHNKMVEGKYPERQAYNKDGLLVTFPTPQHKARAIQRGTHFEQDPSKGAQNVFGGQPAPAGGQPAAAPAAPAAPATPAAPEQPAPNVFAGDQKPAAPAPEKPAAPAGGQSSPSSLPASDTPPPAPAASSAPSGGGGGSSLPASDVPPPANPGEPQLAVEPSAPETPGQPATPIPPPNFEAPKSPAVRAAEAQAVKQMMSGNNNDPSLSPTMPLNVTEQMIGVYNFAKQMGYNSAMKLISEAMNKK